MKTKFDDKMAKLYDKFVSKLVLGKDLTRNELKKAIDQGFDINKENRYKTSLCIWAAMYGCTKTEKVLKELGADIDAQDKLEMTACMCAAMYGCEETLLALVEMGANILIEDDGRQTVIDYLDDDKTVKKVLKLRKEYEQDHPKAQKMADTLATKYFYNKFEKKLEYDKFEKKPEKKELTKEELQEAIDLGFNINKTTHDKWNLFLQAAFYGRTKTVRVLVNEFNVDVNAQDDYGMSACILAARNRHTETLLELVRLGADISIKNNAEEDLFDYIDDKTRKKVIAARREYLRAQSEKTPVKPVDTPQNGQKAREEGVTADKKAHVK